MPNKSLAQNLYAPRIAAKVGAEPRTEEATNEPPPYCAQLVLSQQPPTAAYPEIEIVEGLRLIALRIKHAYEASER